MNTGKIARYFDLIGRGVLVTRGRRGSGLEMCRAYTEAGATVVIS